MVEDAMEGFLHFDGKFFRTARYLFTRPGFLTKEFISGRRTRYTHPLRFYIFASFLFFAVSLLTRHRPMPPEQASARAEPAPAFAEAGLPPKPPGVLSPGSAKAAESPPGPGLHVNLTPDANWDQDLFANPIQINVSPDSKVSPNAILDEFRHLLPTLLFFCIPLLALVLKVVERRSPRFYLEHLVFALHIQAFTFLSFILIKAGWWVGSLFGHRTAGVAGVLLILGMLFGIYRAFRAMYGEGRMMTAFKLALAAGAYFAILIIGIAVLTGLSTYLVSHPSS
jgi:hypothetical protein